MQKKVQTALQHIGLAPFDEHGAAPVPLPAQRSSTVRFQSVAALEHALQNRAQGGTTPPVYGRGGLATHRALEEVFCTLEQGQGAFLLPSGMAAISHALLSSVQQGDHILFADCVYGPVRGFAKNILARMGVRYTFCPPTVAAFEEALTPHTKVLYIESPGSLLMQMLDVPQLVEWAHAHHLLVLIDNTWGSGYSYQPLSLGADISIVAGTKYISGHSDVMLGAVIARDQAQMSALHDTHYAIGFAVSAEDCWLALRGVRTLPLRMQQSAHTALQVCATLAEWPEVERIYHPAWPQDPGHALWQRDALGSNGMVSFAWSLSPAQTRVFVDSLDYFGIGFSWGGFESLIQWVNTDDLRAHSYWATSPQGQYSAHDHPPQVLRLQIGLEAPETLLDDVLQARQRALQHTD